MHCNSQLLNTSPRVTGNSRLLKLLIGVDTSTRDVRRSGNERKVTMSNSRRATAPMKTANFRRPTDIVALLRQGPPRHIKEKTQEKANRHSPLNNSYSVVAAAVEAPAVLAAARSDARTTASGLPIKKKFDKFFSSLRYQLPQHSIVALYSNTKWEKLRRRVRLIASVSIELG